MSYDLSVYSTMIPQQLDSQWLRELANQGFLCELHPGISLLSTTGNSFWLKVISFPPSAPRIQPNCPLLLGFGFEAHSRAWLLEQVRQGDLFLEDLPVSGSNLEYEFFLYTSMGRSGLSLALQVLGAATLAFVTEGVFEDPQEDLLLNGEEAIKFALDLIQTQELARDEGVMPFIEWPPLSFAEELKCIFPSPIKAGK